MSPSGDSQGEVATALSLGRRLYPKTQSGTRGGAAFGMRQSRVLRRRPGVCTPPAGSEAHLQREDKGGSQPQVGGLPFFRGLG